MPVSKKQQASVHKYVRENYDRIDLTVPKGKKADLQNHAQQQNESLNGFVNRAIDETMTRDITGVPAVSAPPVDTAPPPAKKPKTYAERQAYQNSVKPAAHQDYLGGMTAKDIAVKYSISVKAVAAWFGHWKGTPRGLHESQNFSYNPPE